MPESRGCCLYMSEAYTRVFTVIKINWNPTIIIEGIVYFVTSFLSVVDSWLAVESSHKFKQLYQRTLLTPFYNEPWYRIFNIFTLLFVLWFLLSIGVVFIQCQAKARALFIYNTLLLQILMYRWLNTMNTASLKGKPSFPSFPSEKVDFCKWHNFPICVYTGMWLSGWRQCDMVMYINLREFFSWMKWILSSMERILNDVSPFIKIFKITQIR